MAMIALKAPDIEVAVVDINEARIEAWNSDSLPIYEPGLQEVVEKARGRNLFFSTDVRKHCAEADIIFVRWVVGQEQTVKLSLQFLLHNDSDADNDGVHGAASTRRRRHAAWALGRLRTSHTGRGQRA